MAALPGSLAQPGLRGKLLHDGREGGGIAEPALRRYLDGLRAAGAHQADRWMRPLHRPRPDIEEAVGEEAPLVAQRPVLGPGAEDHIQRLLEALARRHRADRTGPVFHRRAEGKGDLDPAARQYVKHGIARRQPVRVLEAGRRAHDGDLRALRLWD